MNIKDTAKTVWNDLKGFVTKGSLDNAVAKSMRIQSDTWSNNQQGGYWMFDAQGNPITHFQWENLSSSLKAYVKCPPVTAVINRKAQAYVNGKTFIINASGKAKGKESTSEMATTIRSLMKKPNALQSWRSFEAQNYIYQQQGGYCVVLPIKPVGFPNVKATRLWNVPSWMLNIIEKPNVNILTATSIKDFVASVQVVYGGLVVNLNLDDIFIFKDFTPSAASMVFPESRLRALEQPVNNVIGAYESRRVLIERRGAMGILSNTSKDAVGAIPIDPAEKELLQEEYRKFGLSRNQWQIIITNAALQWQQMGFPTKELMLFEEIEDDTMQICDAYGYPYRLLSSNKGNSLGGSDLKVFTKNLYQDTIIPEAETMYDQWNEFWGTELYGLNIIKDYKHIHALQEDQVNEATARWRRNQGLLIEFQNNLITLNQWKEGNDDDPVNGDLGDLYYYQLMEKGIKFGQGQSGSSNPDAAAQDNTNDTSNGTSNNNA